MEQTTTKHSAARQSAISTCRNKTHGFSGLGLNFQPAVRKKTSVVASLIPTATYMGRMLHFVAERRRCDVRHIAVQSDSDQIQKYSGAVQKQNNLTCSSKSQSFPKKKQTVPANKIRGAGEAFPSWQGHQTSLRQDPRRWMLLLPPLRTAPQS